MAYTRKKTKKFSALTIVLMLLLFIAATSLISELIKIFSGKDRGTDLGNSLLDKTKDAAIGLLVPIAFLLIASLVFTVAPVLGAILGAIGVSIAIMTFVPIKSIGEDVTPKATKSNISGNQTMVKLNSGTVVPLGFAKG